jgi:excisionase family DNA binding protein
MHKLSTKQAAKRLGLCEATVRNYCVAGKIKGVKFGKSWKITEEEVQYILENGTR